MALTPDLTTIVVVANNCGLPPVEARSSFLPLTISHDSGGRNFFKAIASTVAMISAAVISVLSNHSLRPPLSGLRLSFQS